MKNFIQSLTQWNKQMRMSMDTKWIEKVIVEFLLIAFKNILAAKKNLHRLYVRARKVKNESWREEKDAKRALVYTSNLLTWRTYDEE